MNNGLLKLSNKNLSTSSASNGEPSGILGVWGERIASEWYVKQGYRVLQTNFSNVTGVRRGEIDLIVEKGDALVFVEVKTRSGKNAFENAVLAVSPAKQKKLWLSARFFLAKFPEFTNAKCRFDVCAIVVDKFDKTQFSVTILENVIESLK